MKFKNLDESIYTSDMYYDFFDGGYIKPEEMLEDEEDIKKINEARALIAQFLLNAEEEGVLEIG